MALSDERAASVQARPASRTTDRGDKAKVARPDFYYSDRNKLDDWLNQIVMYITYRDVKTEDQLMIAASFLRGDAQHWARNKITAKLLYNEDPEGMFTNI